jgi:SPP1 family predicted phage head-tail adaptor
MSVTTAGRMRQRIFVEQETSVSDNQGGRTALAWSTFLKAWAEVAPKMGQARLLAMNAGTVNPTEVTLRYRAGINSKMRVRLEKDNRILKIVSVINVEELKQFTLLECSEVSG